MGVIGMIEFGRGRSIGRNYWYDSTAKVLILSNHFLVRYEAVIGTRVRHIPGIGQSNGVQSVSVPGLKLGIVPSAMYFFG